GIDVWAGGSAAIDLRLDAPVPSFRFLIEGTAEVDCTALGADESGCTARLSDVKLGFHMPHLPPAITVTDEVLDSVSQPKVATTAPSGANAFDTVVNATGTPGVSPMTSVVDLTSVGLGQAEDVNALVVTNDVVKRVVSTTSQTIEYEIVVTNTFDHPISDIVVKDDLSIGVACTGMALLNTQQLHLDGLDAHESGRIHVTETISQTGSLSN